MQEYFIIVSKYMLALCMGFYMLESFMILAYRHEEDRKFIYIRQNFWMFLVQITGFANLALVTKDWNYVYLYAFLQVFLLIAVSFPCVAYKHCNRLLLNNMCMLLGVGMMIVSRLSMEKAFRQFVIIFASFIICMFIPLIITKIRSLPKLTWIYAAAGILALSTVLILGEVTHGSKISFTIQGITFQPSEFVKILFIFFMAGALHENSGLKDVIIASILAGIHVIVLVISKDLGSALIFFVGYLAVIFIASRNYLYLLLGLLGGAAASIAAYFMFSHVRVRVLAWLDPWSYIDDQGYQITQSLFAIGSGSWFGMGLHEGNPKAIPYVDVDFIFSSICEEFGVIFGVCLIMLIQNSFIAIMNVGIAQKNNFYKLVAVGLGTMYIFQVFLTIGGGIKFIPLTGVTLPFISYGGSSVLTSMMMFFVIQGIHILSKKEGGKRIVRKRVKDEQDGELSEENESEIK